MTVQLTAPVGQRVADSCPSGFERVALPEPGDVCPQAQTAPEHGTVAPVPTGIKLVHLTNLAQGSDAYPAALDTGAVGLGSEPNALFDTVIDGGVTDSNWKKEDADTYEYVPTGSKYDYNSTTGAFTKQ